MEPSYLDRFVLENTIPPEVDVAAIRREWLALRPPYAIAGRHLPLPVWARRPFTESGPEAWHSLRRTLPPLGSYPTPARPFCIYVHIPFCRERCSFCDCYSFRLAAHRERHVAGYLDLLAREMRSWSGLVALAGRPVSTVHLGGGTPTFLGFDGLERLAGLIRQYFAPGPATEWALESTASELSADMLDHLATLGFSRLHVGVQSLRDDVRRSLNRRAPAAAVLQVLGAAVARGWIASVDLIYGLPGQTLAGLLDDVSSLAAVGVDGFSLYELQLSSRNERFVRQHGLQSRDRRANYLLAQVVSRFLVSRGYNRTLFNHYAGRRDTNLYFTFPERGEDLLALGTIADGVLGDYHYRHLPYAAYRRGVQDGFLGLQGGLRHGELENRLQPLVTALMAGRLPPGLERDPLCRRLLPGWQAAQLVALDPATGDLRLTGNGSWFVGTMISEAIAQGEKGDGDP